MGNNNSKKIIENRHEQQQEKQEIEVKSDRQFKLKTTEELAKVKAQILTREPLKLS